MKAAQLKEIKSSLEDLSAQELLEICLRLAKFKKENKELLTYLLFEAQDEPEYIHQIKESLAFEFSSVNLKTAYFSKKGIRRAIKMANQYLKYTEEKTTKVEVLLFVAETMKNLPVEYVWTPVIENMYRAQIKKISTLITDLHEDLQYDYQKQLDEITGK